jgi:hypothetical protein
LKHLKKPNRTIGSQIIFTHDPKFEDRRMKSCEKIKHRRMTDIRTEGQTDRMTKYNRAYFLEICSKLSSIPLYQRKKNLTFNSQFIHIVVTHKRNMNNNFIFIFNLIIH